MFTYRQRSGVLSHDGKFVSNGYSGYERGRNNPGLQHVHMIGPIPVGKYEIGAPFNSMSHGLFCLRLVPMVGTNTYERDGFLIHGDSIGRPGKASHGCIVLPRHVREEIWQSEDLTLEVITGDAEGVIAT